MLNYHLKSLALVSEKNVRKKKKSKREKDLLKNQPTAQGFLLSELIISPLKKRGRT